MGVVLSTRLSLSILKTLCIDQAFYWTDSLNVWYRIRSHSKSFKPFKANRLGEIQEHTEPKQWRHVAGILNPTDLPTRGLQATDLIESKHWLEGPDLLKDNKSAWPRKPHCDVKSQRKAKLNLRHMQQKSMKKKNSCIRVWTQTTSHHFAVIDKKLLEIREIIY